MHGRGLKTTLAYSSVIFSLVLTTGCMIQADNKPVEVIFGEPEDIVLTGSSPSDAPLNFYITEPLFPNKDDQSPLQYGTLDESALPIVTYTPTTGDCPRVDSFYYSATDGQSNSLPAKVVINIRCAEDFKYIFTTSKTFTGDLGGLQGADLECQDLADHKTAEDSPLRNKRWKAWLSDSKTSAKQRLTLDPSAPFEDKRYVTRDDQGEEVLIAENWADLTDGSIAVKLDRDESNNQITNPPVYVWTSTTASGEIVTRNGQPTLNCHNWTEGSNIQSGSRGKIDDTSDDWTRYAGSNNDATCDASYHLYCVQL